MCQWERAKFQFVFVFVTHGSFSTLKKTAYISILGGLCDLLWGYITLRQMEEELKWKQLFCERSRSCLLFRALRSKAQGTLALGLCFRTILAPGFWLFLRQVSYPVAEVAKWPRVGLDWADQATLGLWSVEALTFHPNHPVPAHCCSAVATCLSIATCLKLEF